MTSSSRPRSRPSSLPSSGDESGSRAVGPSAAYDTNDNVVSGLPWASWNAEKQAQTVERYFVAAQDLACGGGAPGWLATFTSLQMSAKSQLYIDMIRRGQRPAVAGSFGL